jgi:transposase
LIEHPDLFETLCALEEQLSAWARVIHVHRKNYQGASEVRKIDPIRIKRLTSDHPKWTMRRVNTLNLPDWTILHTVEGPRDYQITATYDIAASACFSCWRFGLLQRFGKRTQLFLDLSMHGKRVGIHVERQRYRCSNCGHTMLQPLPHMDEKHQMTKRLLKHIGEASLRRTFVSIAEECGLDEKTVRNVFREHAAELDETTIFATPKWLGIDELTLMRHPRCIMTNLEERTIIALLKNRSQATVSKHLHELHRRGRVKIVAMDMWIPYRNAVRSNLPRACIIVDKFHVVRMANQSLEAVRRELRQMLTDRQRRTLMHDRFVLLRRQ